MLIYLNGEYLDYSEARLPVDERGLQFADGIYEVALVWDGQFIDLDRHLQRLERSAAALELKLPFTRSEIRAVADELLHREDPRRAAFYLQVTRGVAPRDHRFPSEIVPPTVIAYLKDAPLDQEGLAHGVSAITEPDLRWLRCDIKSVSLLPNVLARQHAAARGVREAILVRAGVGVTEGSATNIWMVRHGSIVTAPESNWILSGIVRGVVLELANAENLPVAERFASQEELMQADEVFLTSTTSFVTPIVQIDGRLIGDGTPGPVTTRLQELYMQRLSRLAHVAD
ncbi:MAG: D-amino-acid transaminase [Thermaerobacter sp.]|nr:D-amino-acid transaminase [Thermaerobacter sp.]